jgi:hypothetical protein
MMKISFDFQRIKMPIKSSIVFIIFYLAIIAYAEEIDLKAAYGFTKITHYPTVVSFGNGNGMYGSWDIYNEKDYFYFSAFYKTPINIKAGLSFSNFSAILNKNVFEPGDALFGEVNIQKLGLSLLYGKLMSRKFYPYFLFEPGLYFVNDDTRGKEPLGHVVWPLSYGKGNVLYGTALGIGFDYYFIKDVFGLNIDTRFEIANENNYWLSYPIFQFGLVYSCKFKNHASD